MLVLLGRIVKLSGFFVKGGETVPLPLTERPESFLLSQASYGMTVQVKI